MAFPHFDVAVQLFTKIQNAMLAYNFGGICFKPKQIKCWEHLINGNDVIGVLPTGYGKSVLFQLLADLLPVKQLGTNNIVLVVCPLNSIIEDQITCLREIIGVKCGVLRVKKNSDSTVNYRLFSQTESKVTKQHKSSNNEREDEDIDFLLDEVVLHDKEIGETSPAIDDEDVQCVELEDICDDVVRGSCRVVIGHPEAFLSQQGRKLMRSKVYQKRVVALAIDEAHCVQTW